MVAEKSTLLAPDGCLQPFYFAEAGRTKDFAVKKYHESRVKMPASKADGT
jgi:hypothetical protein